MHLLALICGILLLPKATALECYECLRLGNCSDTGNDCPSSFPCVARNIASYAGGEVSPLDLTSCILAEQCAEDTVNFGVTKIIVTRKCCTIDLCSSQPVAEPISNTPNGRMCYYCNGQTCTETVNCEGNEDLCISATGGGNVTLKGCTSREVCSNMNIEQVEEAMEGKISCCEGDYCNSAGSTTAGLPLLLTPLFPLVIFS